ncbi:UDP-N-acetylglucosamine 2-epimerase (non-hydrolyzing) [Carnobacteriaceae bacterium 52-44]
MKKILVTFGTRPEAIKMAPLVIELKKSECLDVKVCVSGQHKEMLQQVLDIFNIEPDYDLEIMKKNQDLFDITSNILLDFRDVLYDYKPDIVLVHGDTTTAFSAALASFYEEIPIGHIEAGLRTYNIKSPFPEEFNRQGIGLIADYHFSPTESAAKYLIEEKKEKGSIVVTGNTGIDALKYTVRETYSHPELDWAKGSRLILVTAHRRENRGRPLENICRAVLQLVNTFEDVKVIYPVHLSPAVRKTVNSLLADHPSIHLIDPLDVVDFHNFIAASFFVMSDSGGIQEEAPSLGKPVLVLRDTTERPEGIKAGTLKLVGTDTKDIVKEGTILLTNKEQYESMSKANNPYGDGYASARIVQYLKEKL